MIGSAEIGPVSFERIFDPLLLALHGIYPRLYRLYFRLYVALISHARRVEERRRQQCRSAGQVTALLEADWLIPPRRVSTWPLCCWRPTPTPPLRFSLLFSLLTAVMADLSDLKVDTNSQKARISQLESTRNVRSTFETALVYYNTRRYPSDHVSYHMHSVK